MASMGKSLREVCEARGMPAGYQGRVTDWLDGYLDGVVELPKGSDGLPLRPGEAVLLNGSRVTRVRHVLICEGFRVVGVDGGEGEEQFVNECRLAHERPDSWERLEEDANKTPDRYLRDNGIETDGSVPNGYLIQRLDLVRRAKELAGVQKTHTCGEEG